MVWIAKQLRAASIGIRLLPRVVVRPALLGHWLARARAAQLFASVFAVFLWVGLPAISDSLADRYPPLVTEKPGFLGLFERREVRPDPRLSIRRRQLEIVAWAGGGASLALLLLAALPTVVQSGSASPGNRISIPSPRPSVRPPARATEPDSEFASDPDSRTIFAPVGDDAAQGLLLANRYRRLEEIGRGGMGVVYRALDRKLDREVALKALPFHLGERPEITRRFRQEAQLIARLGHPNVVSVYDLFEADSRLWMALELVRGGTLADQMARSRGGLPLRRAIGFARQIAQGLAHAHANGVVHRDVKPSNVLLTAAPEPIAKLTDFGIAKPVDETTHTQAGTLLGSGRYMSPELAAGEPGDARSDAYALGVTIFELVAGRAPFEGELRSVLARQISEPAPPLREHAPSASKALESLVARLLAKRPEERPESLDVVVADLAELERAIEIV